MPRFIHTSDWQLGMTRRFLNPEAQARYSQARIDVIKSIGQLGKTEGCAFIAVAGDVFEFEQMDRQTVAKALDAMGDTGIPVVILPGNHDPHHDDSVYRSKQFENRKQKNIHVLADAAPMRITDDVEVVGAPWHSKHPAGNPVIKALSDLEPVADGFRICLAHGYADIRSFSEGAEALIPTDMLEKAIAEGKIHYAALGDRHSCDVLDRDGRIRYSGTPEQTDFDEGKPGYVALVDLSSDGIQVEERKVGKWKFVKLDRQLAGVDDVKNLLHELENTPEKELTVVRLDIAGSLSLMESESLREGIDDLNLRFAGIDVREIDYSVHAGDVGGLCRHLTGYGAEAAETLRTMVTEGGQRAAVAGDALLLLARLAPAAED